MENQLYALICERDTFKSEDGGRPIIWESYVDGDNASLEKVKLLQERLGNKYGKTRIARLVFIDE